MIRLAIDNADIKVIESETLTSGREGLQCEFTFADNWYGLDKTAVFRAGEVTEEIPLGTNAVTIPATLFETPYLNLEVGVYGENEERAIPTVMEGIGYIEQGTVAVND